MGWISGLVSGISAGAGVRGANMQADRNNRFWQPGQINQYARQFNPWVWNAIEGRGAGQGGFQGDLYKIAQGKDISPYLLNNPLAQINRGADTNLARTTAQLGRSNMSGGLANAYALSNQMGRQRSTSDLYQNYGQFRETQRRNDLNWLMGQVQGSQQQGWDIAGKQQFKKNFWEKLGAFGQAYVAGSGGNLFGKYEDTGAKDQPPQLPQQPGRNPYVDSLGKQGSWYKPPQGGWGS